ncbi:MAG: hypothetical protein L0Y79_10470 [Chlorobi bacterium]|nr:hypothetical protein [Chlorobiota bacterium]MCI0715851.1 hypothetical protein [Chlorobiota bacterium]
MKKLLYILIIHCTLLTVNCFCQSITWQRVYDLADRDDAAIDICQSSEGYFYTVGYANGTTNSEGFVLKLNDYGDTLLKRLINDIGVRAVVPTSDGGCVLTGNADSAFTIKLSSSGNIVWQKFYAGQDIVCNDIIYTIDKYYLISGYDRNVPYDEGYVLKIDSIGNLIWQRNYSTNGDKYFGSILEAIEGNGYVISGSVNEQSVWQAYLLKIDTSGNVVWEKRFRLNSEYTSGGHLNRATNGYLIGGNTGSFRKPYFVKTDTNGDTVFSRTFQFNDNEYLDDLKIANANRYILAILTTLQKDSTARVLVTDSTGNILIQKIFTYGEYASFQAIQTLINGDIIFVGSAEPPLGQWYDTYIIRTDSNLNAPPIGIQPTANEIPSSFYLEQNYPNPFNSSTTITFGVPFKSFVRLIVFDVLGRIVNVMEQGYRPLKWSNYCR